MREWRELFKEYEADLERVNREAKDCEEGDDVDGVRGGGEKDGEEGSSVSMSLTMDIWATGESETECAKSTSTFTPGPSAFLAPFRPTLKRRTFVHAIVRPFAHNSALRAHDGYVSGSTRVYFGPRTFRIPGVVDHSDARLVGSISRKVYSVFSTVFLLLLLLVVAVGCPAAGFG